MKEFKQIENIDFIFKIVYLLDTFISYCSYLAGNDIMPAVTLLLGAVVLLYRIIHFRKYASDKSMIFLILFFISFLISSVLFLNLGSKSLVLKTAIWMALQFFVLFPFDKDLDQEEFHKQAVKMLKVLLVIISIAAVLDLVVGVIGFSRVVVGLDGKKYPFGMYNKRLFGLFYDPNYISVINAVGILISCYFISSEKRKALPILALVVNFLNLMFTGSRTGMLVTGGGLWVLAVFAIWRNNEKLRNNVVKWILSIVLMAAIPGASYFVFTRGLKVYNALPVRITMNVDSDGKKDKDEDLDRSETMDSSDVSNGRFKIWSSAIDVIEREPVFGIGYDRAVEYAKKNIPDTYIVNNPNGEYRVFHNIYLEIFADQGIIGFGIAMAGLIAWLVTIFRKFTVIMHDPLLQVYTACIIGLLISGAFLTELLYINIPTTCIFWIMFGYQYNLMKQNESEVYE